MKYASSSIKFWTMVSFTIVNCLYQNEGHDSKVISKFSFGSCFMGFNMVRTDIFESINKYDPELFVWLGDATYIDDLDLNLFLGFKPVFNREYSQMKFNLTYHENFYSILRKNKPVIGVWDDHDYEYNNGKGDSKNKEITKQLYLDFLDVPIDSNRRELGRPLYSSHSFGTGNKSFKVILLDLRWDLTSEKMMEEDQWRWLEKELNSDETFLFIGSGIQYLPFDRMLFVEKWKPACRKRLIDLIGKTKRSGVIILSGDVHFAQFQRTTCIHPSKLYKIYYKNLDIIYMK